MSSATSLWRLCVVVVIVVTMLAVPAVSHGGEAFPVDVAGDVANDSINDVAGDVTNDVANDVAEHHFLDIRMPGIYPDRDDNYMCIAAPIMGGKQYIVNYEALAEASTAHHMILNHCDEPVSLTKEWMCVHQVCSRLSGSPQILFAWARNAPPLHMPKDVGFLIGNKARPGYFVLQIHYRHASKPDDAPDTSGLRLTLTRQRQTFIAGIALLYSITGVIPPHKKVVNIDMSCQYKGKRNMYPFGFRVHAHTLGKIVSGFMFNGTWTMIGKSDPMWPEAFYPTKQKIVVKPGDTLAARCVFDSTDRNTTTVMGSLHTDEMCNFYVMFYTESATAVPHVMCGDEKRRAVTGPLPAEAGTALARNAAYEAVAAGEVRQAIEVVSDWPRLKTSDNIRLLQISGVATDSKGRVLVFHRGRRVWGAANRRFDMSHRFVDADDGPIAINTLVWLLADGTVDEQWGRDLFYLPHGVHVDANDDVWVTDVGAHQVMKYRADSHKPLLTLGTKLVPGSGTNQFCQPTGIMTVASGDVFISDGYCNSRVMKFAKDGTFLMQWGEKSRSVLSTHFPPSGTFDIPHAITAIEARSTVCVADRLNGRIQCFDYDGKFINQIHPDEFQGTIFDLDYSPQSGVLFALNGVDQFKPNLVLSGFALDPETGKLLQTWDPKSRAFAAPHCLAVSRTGEFLYVGETAANRIWKFRINVDLLPGAHQSVKKSGVSAHTGGATVKKGGVNADWHPASLGHASAGEEAELEEELEEPADLGASLVIGALLVIPVLIIISVTVYLRLRSKGESLLLTRPNGAERHFNLGSLLNRHRGFQRLDTDDAHELDPLHSDSELDEFSVPPAPTRSV